MGINVDFKSYGQKWTIHRIIQNMGFYPPTANPCVMMRENFKTKCCEYIVVYQDDLYITSPPEAILNTLQNKYNLNIKPVLPRSRISNRSRWGNNLSTQEIP